MKLQYKFFKNANNQFKWTNGNTNIYWNATRNRFAFPHERTEDINNTNTMADRVNLLTNI